MVKRRKSGADQTTARSQPTYATPGHLVRRASQIHKRIFDEEFKGLVTGRQFALLVALGGHSGIDQTTLANIVAVDRTTAGGMVGRLVARGYVEVIDDPADARRKLLKLTGTGRRLLERMTPQIDVVSNRLLAPLSDSERATFIKLLIKVATVDDPTFPTYQENVRDELSASEADTSQ
jgi:MarR family transcriptional regulator, lower aerobic nicotinate degradation pathway regulator